MPLEARVLREPAARVPGNEHAAEGSRMSTAPRRPAETPRTRRPGPGGEPGGAARQPRRSPRRAPGQRHRELCGGNGGGAVHGIRVTRRSERLHGLAADGEDGKRRLTASPQAGRRTASQNPPRRAALTEGGDPAVGVQPDATAVGARNRETRNQPLRGRSAGAKGVPRARQVGADQDHNRKGDEARRVWRPGAGFASVMGRAPAP